jgi:hypothetical protein
MLHGIARITEQEFQNRRCQQMLQKCYKGYSPLWKSPRILRSSSGHAHSARVGFVSHDSSHLTQGGTKMSEEPGTEKHQGTHCLHCGEWIGVSTGFVAEAGGASSASRRSATSAYMVLWCRACHKEAPYLVRDFVERKEILPAAKSSAAAVPRNHGLVMRPNQAA